MKALLGTRLLDAPKRLLIAAVRAYRFALSPWLGSSCRFEPSCSAYAIGALQAHGALVGSALAAGRVLRCHPWCDGGSDPVPEAPIHRAGLFTRLLPTTASPVALAVAASPLSPAEKNLP